MIFTTHAHVPLNLVTTIPFLSRLPEVRNILATRYHIRLKVWLLISSQAVASVRILSASISRPDLLKALGAELLTGWGPSSLESLSGVLFSTRHVTRTHTYRRKVEAASKSHCGDSCRTHLLTRPLWTKTALRYCRVSVRPPSSSKPS